jgi:hypothetical protein
MKLLHERVVELKNHKNGILIVQRTAAGVQTNCVVVKTSHLCMHPEEVRKLLWFVRQLG